MAEPFRDPEAALRFIQAGNARLTLRSTRTQTRYTFRVREAEASPNDPRPAFFVSLLKGRDNNADYSYIGMAKGDKFFTTKATRHMENAAFVKAFSYMYRWLTQRRALPPEVEVWHESRCGRCGRPLTVPHSIATGIGPECARHTRD